jgi:hypothetical protein
MLAFKLGTPPQKSPIHMIQMIQMIQGTGKSERRIRRANHKDTHRLHMLGEMALTMLGIILRQNHVQEEEQ